MSLANLKKSRGSSIDKLVNAAAKLNESSADVRNGPDERVWKPTVDKAGNGYAVIRFLPAVDDEDKQTTRDQKRRLKYVSNIYVVSDSGNPENEGKVFLYQYGKKIHDKLMESMQPEFPDDAPVNPFDFWEGADFKLKIRQVDGYRNYDRSEFSSPAVLADDDKLDTIYGQVYPLSEFTDPTNYKSYEELKARLDAVLGVSGTFTPQQTEDLSITADTAPMKSVEPVSAPSIVDADGDDDTMSYFSRLANED